MTDLTPIITDLEQLPVSQAMTGIWRTIPGWPSGGQPSSTIDLDDPDGPVNWTKVEAVATTHDPALVALDSYPKLCGQTLRASELVSRLTVTVRPTEPARMVHYSATLLREAQKRSQDVDTRNLRNLINTVARLYRETHYWATCAVDPKNPPARPDLRSAGIVSTDPKWCTSCARIPHTNSPRHRRSTRCVWCDSFHATYGQDPPVKLLERHLRGERIYQHQIDQAIARHPAKRISA